MHTLQKMALVSAGAVAGAILSLSINAMAEKEPANATTLPLTELRTFTDYYLAMRDYTAQQRSNRVAEGKAGRPGTWQAHCPEATGHE
jgi:hypothetical protein